jgi:hypothetical protein
MTFIFNYYHLLFINFDKKKIDNDYKTRSPHLQSNNKNNNVPNKFNNNHFKKPINKHNNNNNDSNKLDQNIYSIIQIKLFGFDQEFVLHLRSINNDEFLSPNINYLNSLNKYFNKDNETNSISRNCFYIGHVNDDLSSFANINLCHFGHFVSLFFIQIL